MQFGEEILKNDILEMNVITKYVLNKINLKVMEVVVELIITKKQSIEEISKFSLFY